MARPRKAPIMSLMKAPRPLLPSGPSLWDRRWVRALVSLLLMVHLAAVFVAPWAAPPSSPLVGNLWGFFRPYLQVMFLNHGYKFFAPDPGPSHLVRYELELVDGSRRDGIFPNLKEQQPRLLYHRHMMLAERLVVPPDMPFADVLIKSYANSYARHLLYQHQASRVRLLYRTHNLPMPQDVARGMKLDDPRLYQERPLITLQKD